jgi:hypothetical protein
MKEVYIMNYDYWSRYSHLYPSADPYLDFNMNPCMEPAVDTGMVQSIMYPDIYYRIYPYVHRTCDRMDNPYMYYPSEVHVESMVNECYDACVRDMSDLTDYADMKVEMSNQTADPFQIRRRPLLRDLIAILLISELFRRRRRGRLFGYPYNYQY